METRAQCAFELNTQNRKKKWPLSCQQNVNYMKLSAYILLFQYWAVFYPIPYHFTEFVCVFDRAHTYGESKVVIIKFIIEIFYMRKRTPHTFLCLFIVKSFSWAAVSATLWTKQWEIFDNIIHKGINYYLWCALRWEVYFLCKLQSKKMVRWKKDFRL